jgi:hypothetical protein
VRQPGGTQFLLGPLVFLTEPEGAGAGVDEAGVGDQFDVCCDGGGDRVPHLRVAPPELGARYEQQRGRAGEGGHQGLGPVVVGLADLYTPLGQIGGLGDVADCRDDAATGTDATTAWPPTPSIPTASSTKPASGTS